IARNYQSQFLATAAQRDSVISEWERQVDAAEARGEEPPERPKVVKEDRFFTEVSTNAKPDSPRPNGPLAFPEKDSEKLFTDAAPTRMEALKKEMEQLKNSGPPEPPFACGLAEGKIIDQPVFIRGNPEAKGEIVPKRFPVVLAGDQQPPITNGSGRL